MNKQEQTRLDAKLARDLRQLAEAGIEPERDLWPELAGAVSIEGSDETETETVRQRYPTRVPLMAAAVFLAALVGLTWWLLSAQSRPADDFATNFASVRSSADLPAESSANLKAAFASYASEREALLAVVVKELENYPPEVRSEIRQSIEVIEAEMKVIETSLGRLPFEPSAEMRLADLYDMELRLLGVVTERLRGAHAARELGELGVGEVSR